jgi:hypothetical protein
MLKIRIFVVVGGGSGIFTICIYIYIYIYMRDEKDGTHDSYMSNKVIFQKLHNSKQPLNGEAICNRATNYMLTRGHPDLISIRGSLFLHHSFT